jgi:hypothetical protein
MSKVEDATRGCLAAGEQARGMFRGLSDGLNRSSRNAGEGIVCVTGSAVIVGWLKGPLIPKPVALRFDVGDILDVSESNDPLPGMTGALERKNATRALGRAMGNSNTRPTLTLSTRHGDYSLFFKSKESGELRQAYVAISDLISQK